MDAARAVLCAVVLRCLKEAHPHRRASVTQVFVQLCVSLDLRVHACAYVSVLVRILCWLAL